MPTIRAVTPAVASWFRSLSGVGLVLGALFFAASLTPSLIPRSYLTQGVLAGFCFAAGYGAGVFLRWLWRYVEMPEPSPRLRHVANTLAAAAGAAVALAFLWQAAGWQNSVRAAMGMPPVETMHPLKLCAVALLTFAVLLALGRLFSWIAGGVAGRVRRYIPRRVANVLAVAVTALLFWSLGSDVLVRYAFRAMDSSYRRYDALLEPDRPQPADPGKTGSAASLVKWGELGRAGREFVASAPHAQEIAALTGRPALEPVRVYVGLRGAATAEERAELALAELERQGGFDRAVLVIVTPTGTGWVDPSAMAPIEYLEDGDVASVAVQYSYLSSPLSLLAQPEYGWETASALFSAVYGHWTTLPKDRRPKLYLHGLSLGALNSQRSAALFEMIGDPIDGALWSGPPFESRLWRSITDHRDPGTPEWLPRFRDNRLVRFMNQDGPTVPPSAPWGPLRVVYLQHASDPIVFFRFSYLYRRPEWLDAPRGPDVSPELRWYPLVTMLQLAVDMGVATDVPMGYGHVYAPEHYVDAWTAVTGIATWTPEAIDRLKRHLAEAAREAEQPDRGPEAPYDNRGG